MIIRQIIGGGKLELDLPTLVDTRLLIQANSGGGKSVAIFTALIWRGRNTPPAAACCHQGCGRSRVCDQRPDATLEQIKTELLDGRDLGKKRISDRNEIL
jgi:hypothetical protein